MYGGVGNEKMFITEFKKRLRDCCCQGWFSHMGKSERFDLNSCFKNTLERETYLEAAQSRVYKTASARFRMGASRINGHRLCFLVVQNQRFCPFCVDTTEDESHVLFVCPMYGQLREKIPLPVYRGVSMKEGYCRLYNGSDDKTLLNMSRFIFFALKLRESLTSEEP